MNFLNKNKFFFNPTSNKINFLNKIRFNFKTISSSHSKNNVKILKKNWDLLKLFNKNNLVKAPIKHQSNNKNNFLDNGMNKFLQILTLVNN